MIATTRELADANLPYWPRADAARKDHGIAPAYEWGNVAIR